jgi:hypothetical protein
MLISMFRWALGADHLNMGAAPWFSMRERKFTCKYMIKLMFFNSRPTAATRAIDIGASLAPASSPALRRARLALAIDQHARR